MDDFKLPENLLDSYFGMKNAYFVIHSYEIIAVFFFRMPDCEIYAFGIAITHTMVSWKSWLQSSKNIHD